MRTVTCAALLLAACFSASALDDGFPIKRSMKQGTVSKYSMVVDFVMGGSIGHLEATISEKVTDVDKDGNYTIEQTQTNPSGTFAGEKIDVPPRPPVILVYKPSGLVTSIKDGNSAATNQLIDAMSYRMENLATIVDPGKSVQIGDLWTASIKADKAVGSMDAKGEYKLIGEEKIDEIDTIKIKSTVREQDGEKPAINEFTEWRSKADGSMVQLEEKWTNAPFPGVSYPVSATIKMNRLAK